MGAIKDITGAAKSYIKLKSVNHRLTSTLVEKIGGEGTIGAKNMDIYYKKIGDMISRGQHQQAMDYANQEASKVKSQTQEENKLKRAINYLKQK